MANLRLPTTIRSIRPTERRPIRSMTRMQPSRNIAKRTTRSWQLTATTPKEPSQNIVTCTTRRWHRTATKTTLTLPQSATRHNQRDACTVLLQQSIRPSILPSSKTTTTQIHNHSTKSTYPPKRRNLKWCPSQSISQSKKPEYKLAWIYKWYGTRIHIR